MVKTKHLLQKDLIIEWFDFKSFQKDFLDFLSADPVLGGETSVF